MLSLGSKLALSKRSLGFAVGKWSAHMSSTSGAVPASNAGHVEQNRSASWTERNPSRRLLHSLA